MSSQLWVVFLQCAIKAHYHTKLMKWKNRKLLPGTSHIPDGRWKTLLMKLNLCLCVYVLWASFPRFFFSPANTPWSQTKAREARHRREYPIGSSFSQTTTTWEKIPGLCYRRYPFRPAERKSGPSCDTAMRCGTKECSGFWCVGGAGNFPHVFSVERKTGKVIIV